MEKFYEEYKMLINTESAYKDGVPHLLLTGTEYCTQHLSAEVRFDYQKVYDREDTYHDVMGFYHTHPPGLKDISSIDIETMKQWARCLGKSLICLIETDNSLKGWMISKNNDIKEISVMTENAVNYDVWLEKSPSFWETADILTDAPHFEEEYDEERISNDIAIKLEEMQRVQQDMINGFNVLVDTVQSLVKAMTKEI